MVRPLALNGFLLLLVVVVVTAAAAAAASADVTFASATEY